MTPTKEDIKKWLKATGRNRQWLAGKCFVGKRAVDKWMEPEREIPPAKLALIRVLMTDKSTGRQQETPAAQTLMPSGSIELRFDYETRLQVEREALRLGMTLSEYCTRVIEWCCAHENVGDIIAAQAGTQAPPIASTVEDDLEDFLDKEALGSWDDEKGDVVMPWDEERKSRGTHIIRGIEHKQGKEQAQ